MEDTNLRDTPPSYLTGKQWPFKPLAVSSSLTRITLENTTILWREALFTDGASLFLGLTKLYYLFSHTLSTIIIYTQKRDTDLRDTPLPHFPYIKAGGYFKPQAKYPAGFFISPAFVITFKRNEKDIINYNSITIYYIYCV